MPNLPRITTTQERAVLRAFREVIGSIRDQAVIAEVAALIDAGDVEGVVTLLQLDAATFRPLERAITDAYETGGITGAEQIGRIPTEAGTLVARFNVRSPAAEQWLSRMSSRLVTEIVEDQRTMVRQRLTEALAQGRNPRSSALDLIGRVDPGTRRRVGGFIGTTSRQAEWTARARDELESLTPHNARSYLSRQLRDRRFDPAVRRAIEEGNPLNQSQIDQAITQMQNRVQRYRGEVIARTESLNALRAGQEQSIMQAVETGELEQEFATKVWDATGDVRARPAHAAADGQEVPVNQPFIVAGERLMYPGDPAGSAANTIQCRCRSDYRMNFAGQAARRIRGFGD